MLRKYSPTPVSVWGRRAVIVMGLAVAPWTVLTSAQETPSTHVVAETDPGSLKTKTETPRPQHVELQLPLLYKTMIENHSKSPLEHLRRSLRDLRRSFWGLYFARIDFESRQEGMRLALNTWKRERARFEAGSANGRDVARARQQYEFFRAARLQALSRLDSAEARIRELPAIELPGGTALIPVVGKGEHRELYWQSGVNSALNTRAMLSKKHRINLLEKKLNVQRSDHSDESDLQSQRDLQLRLAKFRTEIRKHEHEVIHQLHESYQQVITGKQLAEIHRQRSQAARQQLAAAEKNYLQQKVAIDDLLQAQTAKVDATRDLALCRSQYERAFADWDYYRGR